jgi:hypothetical protein
MVVGLKVGVIPVDEVAVRATALLKPPTGLTLTVEVFEPPAVIVSEVGAADMVKSGPTTVTVTEVVLDSSPLFPNMSTLYDPGIVELTVKVAVYDGLVAVVGVMDALKFTESGEAKRSTGALKPLVGVTVIVDVCGVGPALTVRAGGFAVR